MPVGRSVNVHSVAVARRLAGTQTFFIRRLNCSAAAAALAAQHPEDHRRERRASELPGTAGSAHEERRTARYKHALPVDQVE
jgi:hypothetical protein